MEFPSYFYTKRSEDLGSRHTLALASGGLRQPLAGQTGHAARVQGGGSELGTSQEAA